MDKKPVSREDFETFTATIMGITSKVSHDQEQQGKRINGISIEVEKKLATMGEKKLENHAYSTLMGHYLCKVDAEFSIQRQMSPEEKKVRIEDFRNKLGILMAAMEVGSCTGVMMVAYSDRFKDNPGAFKSDTPPPTAPPNHNDGEGGSPAYL